MGHQTTRMVCRHQLGVAAPFRHLISYWKSSPGTQITQDARLGQYEYNDHPHLVGAPSDDNAGLNFRHSLRIVEQRTHIYRATDKIGIVESAIKYII